MKIIKRNGSEVDFDLNKIVVAVTKANAACEKQELTASQIQEIAEYVEFKTVKANRALSVEEIQDIVEDQIMAQGAFEVARRYVRYRYTRSLIRKANTTDNQILSLIECNNEEVKQENANKNPTVNSVQRDYMAGEVSKDITKRILLPQDIVEAHEAGIIHFHDSDYFAQHMHNCDLVNLEDMLQNGTVISGTMIEKPHSFSTACNIATQIIAQVASNQYGGQSISLGYAGLYECTRYMTGKSHTDDEGGGKAFALSVMQHLNDACDKWKKQENIDFSIYGTPLESTTYKFAKCLQKRFGIIKGVTDKNYITNSYHVHVSEPIDAFTKLKFESEFQRLSPGGAISYVEVPNMQQNIPAVLQVMQYIYDNIMYAELNTKSDYCQCCGYDGEIKIVENADGKLIWQCPNCGNTDQDKMNVARRTCGYIGTQYWNQGRTQEIKDRVLHL